MADFTWEENSKAIFDTACKLAPKPFQQITKKSLNEALEKRIGEGGSVTEEVLLECIKEVTPKPFLAMGMKKIKPLLTNP